MFKIIDVLLCIVLLSADCSEHAIRQYHNIDSNRILHG